MAVEEIDLFLAEKNAEASEMKDMLKLVKELRSQVSRLLFIFAVFLERNPY